VFTATWTLDLGTKRNRFLVQLRSLLECGALSRFRGAEFGFIRFCDDRSELVLAPPTSPGFYPHSEWIASGPVQFGVRSKAQAHHNGDGPGLLGCCNLIDDLEGSAGFTQSPEQGSGMPLPINLREADCLSQAIRTEV
jgi:hypothetical protein